MQILKTGFLAIALLPPSMLTMPSGPVPAELKPGMVITARVRLAARILVPNLKKMTKAPSPNKACTIDGSKQKPLLFYINTF